MPGTDLWHAIAMASLGAFKSVVTAVAILVALLPIMLLRIRHVLCGTELGVQAVDAVVNRKRDYIIRKQDMALVTPSAWALPCWRCPVLTWALRSCMRS